MRTLVGHASHVTSVAFAPDGKRVVSGSLDSLVKIWDTATGAEVQGYLANKKQPPSRTLQKDYAYGPMVVLGGRLFLMSEVSLYAALWEMRSGR